MPPASLEAVPEGGLSVPTEPPGTDCPFCRSEFRPLREGRPEAEWYRIYQSVRERQAAAEAPHVPPPKAAPPTRPPPAGDRMLLGADRPSGTTPQGSRDLGAALKQSVAIAQKYRAAYDSRKDEIDQLKADVRRMAAVEPTSKVAAGGLAGRTAIDDLRNKSFAGFFANIMRAPAVRHVEGLNQAMLSISVSAFSDWKLLCYAPATTKRTAELRAHVTWLLSDLGSVEVLTEEGDEADLYRALLLNAVSEATLEGAARIAFLRSADKTAGTSSRGGVDWKGQLEDTTDEDADSSEVGA
ncbi:MAG: hypothetical protein KGI98_14595 [Euryarchaeota archaeon]|nr:hypothetical protein [Euryarchaeota archaeon]MDE1881174.1 hypothetical protein [Euryarchaeota archaeon]